MIRVLRETHETPEFVERRLRLAGGLNRFGEPNFRAVWGWNRLTWIGGSWEDRNESGELIRKVVQLRREPKYFPINRWHFETWVAPEIYGTPAQWHERTLEIEGSHSIPALGPYPSRGEYELAFTLQGSDGEFVQLTPTLAEHVAYLIKLSRRFTPAERWAALQHREAHAERAYDSRAFDILDDAVPAFHGLPFVTRL